MAKHQAAIQIFDATGVVVHRLYVDDPSLGLRGANLEGLIAPLGQFQGLDLSKCNLYWASLADADLSFAVLTEADLRGANLCRTKCRNTVFRKANLGRDNLGGRTMLQGADLQYALLHDCNLEGAVFDDTTKFPLGFNPHEVGMVHVDELQESDPNRVG